MVRCRGTLIVSAILSRKARGPRSTCRLAGSSRELLLLRAVREHGEELIAAETIRLKHEMAATRGPRRALVPARTGGEAAEAHAVGAHGPDVMIALTRGERDGVALRGPPRLGVEAVVGQAADIRALCVHHVEL